jgi:hypothetical protein
MLCLMKSLDGTFARNGTIKSSRRIIGMSLLLFSLWFFRISNPFEVDYIPDPRRPGVEWCRYDNIYMVLEKMISQQVSAVETKDHVSLPRFHEVRVGSYSRGESMQLFHVAPFLKLPSVAKLEFFWVNQELGFTHKQEQPSHMKDLTIFECHLDPAFFTCFHFLKSFKYK